jgi:rubrerythrin
MMIRSLFSIVLVFLASFALSGCKEENKAENKDETTKNLEAALAGEGEATRKYSAFAEIADQEGYPSIARLWRAAAA